MRAANLAPTSILDHEHPAGRALAAAPQRDEDVRVKRYGHVSFVVTAKFANLRDDFLDAQPHALTPHPFLLGEGAGRPGRAQMHTAVIALEDNHIALFDTQNMANVLRHTRPRHRGTHSGRSSGRRQPAWRPRYGA